MELDQLKPNLVIRGALFPEPVQVIRTIPLGQSVKLIGQGKDESGLPIHSDSRTALSS
jgi:hypothetical protein